jgi:hypothetical protein
MYDACRVLAQHVTWKGGQEWDWSRQQRRSRVSSGDHRAYLTVTHANAPQGLEDPETTLVYPDPAHVPRRQYIFGSVISDCILGAT